MIQFNIRGHTDTSIASPIVRSPCPFFSNNSILIQAARLSSKRFLRGQGVGVHVCGAVLTATTVGRGWRCWAPHTTPGTQVVSKFPSSPGSFPQLHNSTISVPPTRAKTRAGPGADTHVLQQGIEVPLPQQTELWGMELSLYPPDSCRTSILE